MQLAKSIDTPRDLLRFLSTPSATPQQDTIVLFSTVYPSPQDQEFIKDFESRLWMTYRTGFPPIISNDFTSDQGWGCMLRSGQMLLANCMVLHELGFQWILNDDFIPYANIVLRFLDSPTAPYSIHKIALEGQRFGKQVGEWFGPLTISQVLKTLVQNDTCGLGIHVAQDGMFFKNEARQEFTMLNQVGQVPSGLLLLVNVRLGLDKLNPLYHSFIKKCFDLPCFVGIAGGRPNSSMYFIGYQGDNLLYLDPHYMRPSVPLKDIHSYQKDDLSSYHCDKVRLLPLEHVDPSMVLGFYCRNEKEFDQFCVDIQPVCTGKTPLFSMEETSLDLKKVGQEIVSDDDF